MPSAGPVLRVQRPSRVWSRSLLRQVGLLLGVSLALVIGFGVLLWLGLGRPDLTGRPHTLRSHRLRRRIRIVIRKAMSEPFNHASLGDYPDHWANYRGGDSRRHRRS